MARIYSSRFHIITVSKDNKKKGGEDEL